MFQHIFYFSINSLPIILSCRIAEPTSKDLVDESFSRKLWYVSGAFVNWNHCNLCDTFERSIFSTDVGFNLKNNLFLCILEATRKTTLSHPFNPRMVSIYNLWAKQNWENTYYSKILSLSLYLYFSLSCLILYRQTRSKGWIKVCVDRSEGTTTHILDAYYRSRRIELLFLGKQVVCQA